MKKKKNMLYVLVSANEFCLMMHKALNVLAIDLSPGIRRPLRAGLYEHGVNMDIPDWGASDDVNCNHGLVTLFAHPDPCMLHQSTA